MKTFRNLTIILLFIFSIGCSEDFIEREPQTSMSENLALSNFKNIKLALNGAYAPLYDVNYYGRNFVVTPAIKGGNAIKSKDYNSGRFPEEYNWINTPANTSNLLLTGYEMISAANNVINALDGFSEPGVTQEEIDQVKGEALFLRALAYFDLTRMYCQPYSYAKDNPETLGMPIMRETKISKPSRDPLLDVYDNLIVPDLKNAETLIKGNTQMDRIQSAATAKGFASQESVQALLSKVYLYMEEWQNAADYATEVIQSGKYELYTEDNYTEVWNSNTGSEVIFMVYGDATQSYWPGYDEIGYILRPEDGYGDVAASNDLIGLFESGDVRRDMISGLGYSNTEEWTTKYPGKASIRENNIPVLRLSEMYLIRAEASKEGASGYNALDDYNMIRTHRGLSEVTSLTIQDIYDERRRELNFEANALWDLSRTGRNLQRPGSDVQGNAPAEVSFPDYKWAMPIPVQEIDANPNFEQNPGY